MLPVLSCSELFRVGDNEYSVLFAGRQMGAPMVAILAAAAGGEWLRCGSAAAPWRPSGRPFQKEKKMNTRTICIFHF